MSVVNLKGTLITNRDATPKVLTDAIISGGTLEQAYGWIFTGSADSAGSQYRLCQVPSDSRLSALDFANGALGSGSILDIAVWYPTYVPAGGGAFLTAANQSVLISSSAFGTAGISGNTAVTTFTNQITSTNVGINYQEMPLWQMIGLTSDPEIYLDIGLSVRIAVASAGYVGLKATYAY